MARKVTICSLQWGDLPLAKVCETMAELGYDGLELGLIGDHFDVEAAAKSKGWCDDLKGRLAAHGLGCWAISAHLQGQLVCDVYDARHAAFAPKALRKDPKAMRAWAVKTMKLAAKAARNMGINVVNGFTGSSIWPYLYSFPPVTKEMIAEGYRTFAKAWKPILDVFADNGVKFALEVHPPRSRSTSRPPSARWRRSAGIPRSGSTTTPRTSATRAWTT